MILLCVERQQNSSQRRGVHVNVVGAQAADHAQVPVGVDQVCRGLSEALLQLLHAQRSSCFAFL